MNKYTVDQIDDYKNKLNTSQKEAVVKHCNEYGYKPTICAWYDDKDDFVDAWAEVGYSKDDALQLLSNNWSNPGEFLIFDDDQIIRFVL